MKSIVCKNCLPEEYLPIAKQLNGYWEVDNDIAKCNNCGFERPYFTRKPQVNKITPSQQKTIDRIKHYFKDWRSWDNAYKFDNLHKFEIELNDYGRVFVKVETNKHIFTREGGYFSIGRRGGIKVHDGYCGIGDRDFYIKHYAHMLHAQIGW